MDDYIFVQCQLSGHNLEDLASSTIHDENFLMNTYQSLSNDRPQQVVSIQNH